MRSTLRLVGFLLALVIAFFVGAVLGLIFLP